MDQSLVTPTNWQILRHAHDPLGRVLSQTLFGGKAGQTSPQVITHRGYAYRPDGYPVATVDESGDRRTLTLDPVGRITMVTARDWLERYAYSPSGDITHADWPSPATSTQPGVSGSTREPSSAAPAGSATSTMPKAASSSANAPTTPPNPTPGATPGTPKTASSESKPPMAHPGPTATTPSAGESANTTTLDGA